MRTRRIGRLLVVVALSMASCGDSGNAKGATADEAKTESCSTLARTIKAARTLQETTDKKAKSTAAAGSPERNQLDQQQKEQDQVFRRLLLQAAQLGTQSKDTKLKAGSSLVLQGGTDKEFAGFDLMRRACT